MNLGKAVRARMIVLAAACSLLSAAPGRTQAPGALPQPPAYVCHRAPKPPAIDGMLNDSAWRAAPWSTDFVDIEGDRKPAPRYRTRVKMLWDDTYLYIAAEMEEPDIKATLRKHDSVIFKDNDFELFVKPLPATESYYEYEINAFNTGWDLFLNKPYNLGGKADSSWEMPGLRTAVSIDGTINQSSDTDRGWTVEIALPLAAFETRQHVPLPQPGTEWRINLSRVEWKEGQPKPDNWVWAPQYAVNMHIPEHWGSLRFER